MKKVAKAMFLALSILAISGLVGCANDSEDNSDSLVYLTESAPTGVGSFAIEGANVVYWDLVKDNKYGLQVVRYTDNVATTVLSVPADYGQSITCYVDAVTYSNPLENGKTYTYRVYNLGGATVNRAVTVANDMDSTLSAYASTSVKANIPTCNSKITAPATSDISASVVKNSSGKKSYTFDSSTELCLHNKSCNQPYRHNKR